MAERRLRVVTLNVWALPYGIARHVEPRLAAIGAELATLGADLVAYQEVWTASALETLRASGRACGLEHAWLHRAGYRGSGLLVLSRWPIRDARFEAYEAAGLPERIWNGDAWAGKGFGELRIDHPAGRFGFVATHLHAQYAPQPADPYDATRMAQVLQLAVRLRERAGPLVAAGDFNLLEHQPHYAALTGIAGLRDAAVETGRRQATALADSPYRGPEHSDERIDYVFVRDGGGLELRVRGLARGFDAPFEIDGENARHSDHAGLVADLELAAGAPDARLPPPDRATLAAARASLERGLAQALGRRDARRRTAIAAGVAGAGLLAARRITRRTALRRLVLAGGALGGVGVLGGGWLAERASPAERQALAAALARIDALSAPASG